MQIRCSQCHRPFALSKDEIYAALSEIEKGNLHYYNAHCPHCRKVNHVSAQELHRAAPDWGKEDTSDEHITA